MSLTRLRGHGGDRSLPKLSAPGSASDALDALQLTLTAVQLAGGATCAFTAAIGCGVSAGAGTLNAGIDATRAVVCHMSSGDGCGVKTALAAVSVFSAGYGAATSRAISAASAAGRLSEEALTQATRWAALGGLVIDGNLTLPWWGVPGVSPLSVGSDGSVYLTTPIVLLPAP